MFRVLKFPLLLVSFFLFSCSSDDDNDFEQIVGTWNPVFVEFPENPGVLEEIDDCSKNDRYQFNADGTISLWDLYTLNNSNECFLHTQLTEEGDWLRLDDDINFGNFIFEISTINPTLSEPSFGVISFRVKFLENGQMTWQQGIGGGIFYLERI